MRLWSLHPKYLDGKGLVALWREGLLAQAVLAGKTKGYKDHPQLERFKAKRNPLLAIGVYLHHACNEAERRGYDFDRKKITKGKGITAPFMTVSRGQLRFEWEHLRKKLIKRDPAWLRGIGRTPRLKPHPSFGVVAGGVAGWERN
jgi:hypothetical protein